MGGCCSCADFGRGASKLALSTISSEALWTKSGRLEKGGQEVCNENPGGSRGRQGANHGGNLFIEALGALLTRRAAHSLQRPKGHKILALTHA